MDSIQSDNGSVKASYHSSVSNHNQKAVPTPPKSNASSLDPKLSNLSPYIESAATCPDIRGDAIERARMLINDPNWLSDNNLDSLASKVAKLENL